MLYEFYGFVYCSIHASQLELTPVIGKDGFYYVDSPFYVCVFMRGQWVVIYIPKGFYTDLMSAGKSIKKRLGIKKFQHVIASIVHDALYANRVVFVTETEKIKCTRKEADKAMMDLMNHFGESPSFVIENIYDALRGIGWIAWTKHRVLGLLGVDGHRF